MIVNIYKYNDYISAFKCVISYLPHKPFRVICGDQFCSG